MTNPIPKIILLAILAAYGSSVSGQDTPAINKRFALPLAGDTTAAAVFLAAPKNNLHLIYATPTGKLVWWQLSQTEPDPGPVPPDPPPPVKSLKIAVVHDPTKSTAQERQVMADAAWRDSLPPPHEFSGIIPFGLLDPNTKKQPVRQRPFLQAASGHALPCLVLLNESSEVVAVVPLPATAADILKLVLKHGGTKNGTADNRRGKLSQSNKRTNRPTRTKAIGPQPRVLATAL